MLLPSDWVALILCSVFGVVLTWLARQPKRGLRALGWTCIVLVWLVHIVHSVLEYPWVWLVPHPASTTLMYAAVWPVLIAALFALAPLLKRDGDRRVLYLVSIAVGLYGAYNIALALQTPRMSAKAYWVNDVLVQTADSTCIAAASATLLKAYGITLDETTAAKRGLIGREGGRLAQAWRILRLSAPSYYGVRIGRVGRAGFSDGKWRVVSERLLLNTGHALAASMQPDGTMLIRDPANGTYGQTWEEFEQHYLGTAVWLEIDPRLPNDGDYSPESVERAGAILVEPDGRPDG